MKDKGKSICMCGHTGDGKDSQHGDPRVGKAFIPGLEGHGACRVRRCPCAKFTWAKFVVPPVKKKWAPEHNGYLDHEKQLWLLRIEKLAQLIESPLSYGDDSRDEACNKLYKGIDAAIAQYAEDNGFTAVRQKNGKVKIDCPNWRKAASRAALIHNGVGFGRVNGADGLIALGPYCTARAAVLNHLRLFTYAPELFGGRKYSTIVEDAL